MRPSDELSIRKQCEILNVARSGLDYVPVPEGERSHRLKRIMDRGGAGKRSQWDRKEKEYALGGKPRTET